MKTLSSPRRMQSIPLGRPLRYKEVRGTSAETFYIEGTGTVEETVRPARRTPPSRHARSRVGKADISPNFSNQWC